MTLDGIMKAVEVFTKDNRTLYLYNCKGELVWI